VEVFFTSPVDVPCATPPAFSGFVRFHGMAKSERDSLATELRTSYPSIEARLAELIAKIEVNDREIEFVTPTLPNGAQSLRSAELVARELESWRESNRSRADHQGVVFACFRTRPAPALCVAAIAIGKSTFAGGAVRSKPDMTQRHVRFTPQSGHVQCNSACPLCANSRHQPSVAFGGSP
jgi:hypothetical protein